MLTWLRRFYEWNCLFHAHCYFDMPYPELPKETPVSKSVKNVDRIIGSLNKVVVELDKAQSAAEFEALEHLDAAAYHTAQHKTVTDAAVRAATVKENFKQLLGNG